MRYIPELIEVRLERRYKRFLADVHTPLLPEGAQQLEGEPAGTFTVHCANPGSMKGLVEPNARAWIFDSGNPKRKLRYSLELVETREGAIVCVNTVRANALIWETLELKRIPQLAHLVFRPEVSWGEGAHRSRFDFAFWASGADPTAPPPLGYLEVKSVTYAPDPRAQSGRVAFPDAVTARGLKHLDALSEVVQQGYRAVLCFCVNRNDARSVTIAEEIDPAYAAGLRRAKAVGVEVIAIRAEATPSEHYVTELIPFEF